MKIRVNYDLFEKIVQAESGLSIKRRAYDFLKISPFVCLIVYGSAFAGGGDINFQNITLTFSLAFLFNLSHELIDLKSKQKRANESLSMLVKDFNKLNISTTEDLIKESELYHSHYEVKLNSWKIPYLYEQKFIMVKTVDDNEVSIKQEHVIGSRKWNISVGEPEKQYKLSLAKQST